MNHIMRFVIPAYGLAAALTLSSTQISAQSFPTRVVQYSPGCLLYTSDAADE